jgi:hypothetical protein
MFDSESSSTPPAANRMTGSGCWRVLQLRRGTGTGWSVITCSPSFSTPSCAHAWPCATNGTGCYICGRAVDFTAKPWQPWAPQRRPCSTCRAGTRAGVRAVERSACAPCMQQLEAVTATRHHRPDDPQLQRCGAATTNRAPAQPQPGMDTQPHAARLPNLHRSVHDLHVAPMSRRFLGGRQVTPRSVETFLSPSCVKRRRGVVVAPNSVLHPMFKLGRSS